MQRKAFHKSEITSSDSCTSGSKLFSESSNDANMLRSQAHEQVIAPDHSPQVLEDAFRKAETIWQRQVVLRFGEEYVSVNLENENEDDAAKSDDGFVLV